MQQRTTRSPKHINNDDNVMETYPWYWLALLGFLVSSLIGLIAYCSLRRCRHQQRPIRRQTNGKRSTSPNLIIQNNEKTEARTSLLKLNGHITDESLVSRCTTTTNATMDSIDEKNKLIKIQPPPTTNEKKTTKKKTKKQKKLSDESDEDNFNGKELSVIDPFLNKQYSGKMHVEQTTN